MTEEKILERRCRPVECPKEFEPNLFDVTGSHQLHASSMLAYGPTNVP